jgi:Ca-activated chloride channel family protein
MFHFTEPVYLLLLPAVPLVVWWWLRRRRAAVRFPDTGWLGQLPAGRSRWATGGGALLRGAALALLVIALAGPQWPDQRTRLSTEGIAIQMVVDLSPSMAERDFDWQGLPLSRLEAAKKAFRLFVAGSQDADSPPSDRPSDGRPFEGRPNDLIGLVTFGDRPETTCPLTLSHSVLLRLLDAAKPLPVSETNVSDALVLGLYRLKNAPPNRKVLVLLSDGEHNYLAPRSEWTPRQAAQIAANLGIPVYTIDAGGDPVRMGEPGSPEGPNPVRLDGIRTLQDLARITGGKYFQARDSDTLLNICREIGDREREPIESFQYRRFHEGFRWFGLAALVLFTTACVLDRTVWLRIP